VWRIKYCDAVGQQVVETLGREPGWNRERALRELGKRLGAVERGYRKPQQLTFAAFSERFTRDYLPGRNLRLTTLESYRSILERHLLPYFGSSQLGEIAVRPELIDLYISQKTDQGLSPKTIHNQLMLLHLMLRRATIWRLIQTNPVAEIDRPRLALPEIRVLSTQEIARLTRTLDELHREASEMERPGWQLAKAIVLTALGTALRRGELLGLRWRSVDLEEGTIDVREALVRGRHTRPKSKASRRRIELGSRTRAVLRTHRRDSRFTADDDLVFCNPERGTPIDPSGFARVYLRPALAKAAIDDRFRPFHDLRHTSLTHAAAAGNPHIYLQARAGHAHGAITERYLHPTQLAFPGAAERGENQMFGKRPTRFRQLLRRAGIRARRRPKTAKMDLRVQPRGTKSRFAVSNQKTKSLHLQAF
jgi:integrase